MKKLFLLLALIGIVAIGCSKNEIDNGNDNNNNKTEHPDENEGGNKDDIPENIFFGLDKESITFSPDGGSVDVVVYSNYKWEISGKSDWCTPSVKTGNANEDGQIVTFSADVAYDDREATFWFRCADEKIKFVVSQKFKEAIIPDANNSFNIPAEGGIAVISYKTSVDCEIIIPEEADGWITIVPATRGLVSESINLDISKNTTYDPRSAVIKVVAKDNAELVVEYTINQEQKNALLADGNSAFTVPNTGGKVVIKYQTNIDCEVIIPEEAQDWITIAPATRGLVAYNTTLNIAANNSGKQRSSVVKVISQEHNELFAEYTITQNTRCCLYYTSNNGKIVTPSNRSSFDAAILSNTYKDGVGVIEFSAPITKIADYAFDGYSKRLISIIIPDSVTEIGDYAFRDCRRLNSITIPDSVTEISAEAFKGCTSLTSVIIPDSLTKIGDYAFSGCTSLTSMTIPDSVTEIGDYAFRYCSSLQEFNGKFASEDGRCLILDDVLRFFAPAGIIKYTIPDSVTEIGDNAFDSCSSLIGVTIPDSVTEIGYFAFRNCSSLKSLTIPDNVTKIKDHAFSGCVGELIISSKIIETNYTSSQGWLSGAKFTKLTIGEGIKRIGDYAFSGCSLESITIPASVTSIGNYAFANCSNFSSVTVPDSVTEIGDYAFSDCTCELIMNSKIIETNYTSSQGWLSGAKFTKLTIGEGIKRIGDYAFSGCSLESITIPASVTSIGNHAFYDCRSLASVTIPNSVTEIKHYAFGNCSSLESITIPASVTSIGDHAFYDCSSLASVTIPNSVTSIGNYAFYDCSSLASVTIPNSVTEIKHSAFSGCSIKSITIPASVTSIGSYAFYDCRGLKNVYCKSVSPPSLGTYAFYERIDGSNFYREINCDIYVPTKSVEAYKSAREWKQYAYHIVGYDF